MMKVITATAALVIAAAAHAEPLLVPKPSGPAGSRPLSGKRLVLRPRPGRAGGDRPAAERHMMDCVGLLLPA
jgi:hypothetical protein